MNKNTTKILGILLALFYGFFIAWLYTAAPKTLVEMPSKARETIENATIAAQVITNTYEIDRQKFEEARRAFRADNFVGARDLFEKADPEKLDAETQFYVAYSYYRQGYGKLSNDDALFRKGLEQTALVVRLDKNFVSTDSNLQLKTPAELKNEFEEGLKITADDFNPLKVFKERK